MFGPSKKEKILKTNVLSDENIYVDVALNYVSVPGDLKTSYIAAQYKEERSSPFIVDDPSQYAMSIVRFDAPLSAMPKHVFRENFLYVTLVHPASGLSQTTALTNVRRNFRTNTGTANDIYYYKQFVKSVNNAFSACLTALVGQYDALNGANAWNTDGTAGTRCVSDNFTFINYDSGLFYLNTPVLNADTNAQRVEIYMSYHLYDYFSSFDAELLDINNTTSYRDYRLIVEEEWIAGVDNIYTYTVPATDVDYFLISQEISTKNKFYSLYKVVIESQTTSLRQEFISVNEDRGFDTFRSGNNAKQNIVSDFNYNIDDVNNDSNRIDYNPSGEFRWIDIKTNTPLRNMDFSVYIENLDGQLVPLLIPPGESFNIKVLFKKK